jgi:hypothetical protein
MEKNKRQTKKGSVDLTEKDDMYYICSEKLGCNIDGIVLLLLYYS